MGRKRKHGYRRQHHPPTPIYKKKETPGWVKTLVAILFIGVVGVGVLQLLPKGSQPQPTSQPNPQQSYPTYATGAVYNNPTVTGDGTKIQLPLSFIKDKKIVFADAKLANQTNELQYQSRSIPLNLYRGGNYLPLIALYTPSGSVIAGIRTCEPCGSFSMHIGEGKYLICDSCGTKWDIETLKGVSGGCPDYPPPKLTSSVSGNIEIDLAPLGIKVTL